MGFEKAKIEIKPAAIGTGIKVSLKKVRQSDAKMNFTFSGNVVKEHRLSDGDKLEVLIGTETDHGILRFRKNNSSGEAVVKFKKAMGDHVYAVIQLGHQSRFVDRAEPGKWCQWEALDDGWIEVILPRWADETNPVKKPKEPEPKVTQTINATRPANVTAGLMGDPPPGRKEMLAKIGSVKS